MQDQFEYDFAVAASSSYDADGYLSVGIDQYGNTGADPVELHHQFGFACRPLDPQVDSLGNVTNGCTMKVWTEGSRKHGMPLGDPSVVPNLALLGKGDSMQYSASGSFWKLTGQGVNKGRIAGSTSDTNGFDMGFVMDPTSGHSLFGRYGQMSFGPTGWRLRTLAGPTITVGGVTGPGLGPAGQFISMRAGTVRLLAPTVVLGGKGIRSPVALATPLAAALATVSTALQSVATALTALGATPAANGVAPAAACAQPLASAITAVQAAVAALAPAAAGQPTYAAGSVVAS